MSATLDTEGRLIEGTGDSETLAGGAGNDTIIGNGGTDNLNGGGGNDSILGGANNDELIGGAGNDTLDGGGGRNKLFGGSGSDVYIFGRDTRHSEIFDAGGDDDAIVIDALSSEVTFEVSGQYLLIRLGDSGVAVRDYFSETDYGRIEHIVFSDGTVWTRNDVLHALETRDPEPKPEPDPGPSPIIVGTDGNDVLTGSAGSELIDGKDGNDTLHGGAGNDTLDGGAGNDLLLGGAGNDTYHWNGGNDTIDDSSGDDTIRIDFDDHITWSYQVGSDDLFLAADNGDYLTVKGFFDAASSIQRFAFSNGDILTRKDVLERLPHTPPENPPPPVGTEGNDSLQGTDADDVLDGKGGNDTLDGGKGNDLLIGGHGNDTFIWTPDGGEDLIVDHQGNDTVIVKAASTSVVLTRDTGDTDTLVISQGEARLKINKYFVTAEAQDDEAGHIETITFSDGESWNLAKVLAALDRDPPMPTEPDKIITGSKGKDVLVGGVGNDTLDGGKGNDVLRGGSGDDRILGGRDNDKLFGDDGDDLLDGGVGKDTLVGGTGADVFRFGGKGETSPGKNRDVILDFAVGVDRIDLSGIDANTRKKGHDAFATLLSAKEKFTAAGQLRYDAKKGILYGNTDKDAAAELEIHLKNKPAALKLSDFIL
ncbi:calcium-binding protein [Microvirga sp. 2TAF3]|uniref:calcium-binding protein n=1 Tax=Microvirga sp. 2TAF3 TaxID=3233014 RepID=UPI003F9A5D16